VVGECGRDGCARLEKAIVDAVDRCAPWKHTGVWRSRGTSDSAVVFEHPPVDSAGY
jgi:hypothetical protein